MRLERAARLVAQDVAIVLLDCWESDHAVRPVKGVVGPSDGGELSRSDLRISSTSRGKELATHVERRCDEADAIIYISGMGERSIQPLWKHQISAPIYPT